MTRFLRRLCVLPLMLVLASCGSEEGYVLSELVIPSAFVRVVHAIPSAPEIQVLVQGQQIGLVNFSSATRYQAILPAATRTLELRYFDGEQVQILSSMALNIPVDGFRTILIMGTLAEPEVLIFEEESVDGGGAQSQVRFAHASLNAPDSVDFSLVREDGSAQQTITLNRFAVSAEIAATADVDQELTYSAINSDDTIWTSNTFSLTEGATVLVVLLDYFGPGNLPARPLVVSPEGINSFPEEQLDRAVRFAHMVADDTLAYDFYLDDELVASGLAFGEVGDYQLVSQDNPQLRLTEAGNPENVLLVTGTNLIDEFSLATYHTLTIGGPAEARQMLQSNDNLRRVEHRATMVVSNYSVSDSDFDVYLSNAGEDFLQSPPLPLMFGETKTSPLVINPLEMRITAPAGTVATAGPFSLDIQSRGLYRIFITDQIGGGTPVIILRSDDYDPPFDP
ncbi:MAG: DUF4397 domain-containing protein [Proteobacteria bacterium]|jgi:hypothetical protein|nr:DUF4397 domain-containing protein [Pseudomonadota bacterium]MDA1301846.1 DUF4397 domain-containing protein [Pseudomonadota bacterium]